MTTGQRPLLILITAALFTSQHVSAFITPHQSSVTHHHASVVLSAESSNTGSNNDVISNTEPLSSRRTFTTRSLFTTTASLLLPPLLTLQSSSSPALAAADEELVDVYFGCGCFWHVQHEFVQAEKKILGRKDDQITARAGYAGGKKGMLDGKVCYHNAASIADYGKLGHAEVVGLKIPPSSFNDFAVEYFKLFDAKGDRPDQAGDRGGEYRSLVGIPGGAKSEYAKVLVDASIATGDKLDFAFGKGDDPDARKTSFVMDSANFPFYVAEQYHQFHDGFNIGENYPGTYNGLAGVYKEKGEDFGSCPNGSLGLGIGGL